VSAPTSEGRQHLRRLVAETYRDTYETTGGVVRLKTRKRREQEKAVADAVVRFAFDHGGYRGEHLAPGGLWAELMP
jgi:hypothetical protein